MILPKEKVNRYLRHIILPEISGEGQKKIIESKVLIYASKVEEVSALIYYLSASGAGNIQCILKDTEGFEELYRNIKDMDCDVELKLYENEAVEKFTAKIFICNYDNISDVINNLHNNSVKSADFIPVVISITNSWRGFIQIFNNQQEFNELFFDSSISYFNNQNQIEKDSHGSKLSNCLIGALTSIEAIKIIINYKDIPEEPLYFNLLNMEFTNLNDKNFWSALSELVKSEKNSLQVNYSKQSFMKNLKDSRVLVVGTGGLGSSAAYALANLGIGTIGLVDFDNVELSNLSRQIVHATSRIDMPKVESAKIFLNKLNPDIKIETINVKLDIKNALDIVKEYDVIVDAVDNIQTRYLLNDACYFADKPLIEGAAIRFYGVIMTIIPNAGPCYRCIFDVSEKSNMMMSCSEAGVLGPVPGVIGFIQASEVIKLLTGKGDMMVSRIAYYDALYSDFETLKICKSTECKLCGDNPKISSLNEYKIFCSMANK